MSEKEDQLQEYQQQEKKVEQKQELDLDYQRMVYCDTCGKHTFWIDKNWCSICSKGDKT